MSKRCISLCAIFFTVVSTVTQAGTDNRNFGTLHVKNIVSIYDGDTFRADLADVHPIVGDRIAIRVSGVDTPEIRGKCLEEVKLAKQAKQFTFDFLRSSRIIELRNVTRGKYFRIVADVYGDDKSLTAALIGSGLAVPYDGGRKSKDWCIAIQR